jgi:hypothetical protein
MQSLLASPAFSQSGGVLAGAMYGQGGSIDHYGSFSGYPSRTAEHLAPGWSFGLWYAFADSGLHVRLEAAWDHHTWEQHFVSDASMNHGPWWGYSRQEGEMTKTFGILRFSPQLVFPIRNGPIQLFIAGELGFVAQVLTEEVSRQIGESLDHHSGQVHSYVSEPEMTYSSDPRLADQYQFGIGGGVRITMFRRLSLGIALIQNLQDLSPYYSSRDGLPKYLRGTLGMRLFPWHG